MAKEYVSPVLCLEGFLGNPQLSFHFSVFMVSQREYVSKTPLFGVIMAYKHIALHLFMVQLAFIEHMSECLENTLLFSACV